MTKTKTHEIKCHCADVWGRVCTNPRIRADIAVKRDRLGWSALMRSGPAANLDGEPYAILAVGLDRDKAESMARTAAVDDLDHYSGDWHLEVPIACPRVH